MQVDTRVGDKIQISAGDGNFIPASVVAVHESGAVDAKIEQEGHPANGSVTHVAANNFVSADQILRTVGEAHDAKVQHLGQYTTVTRG
jgi:hypothetical protein